MYKTAAAALCGCVTAWRDPSLKRGRGTRFDARSRRRDARGYGAGKNRKDLLVLAPAAVVGVASPSLALARPLLGVASPFAGSGAAATTVRRSRRKRGIRREALQRYRSAIARFASSAATRLCWNLLA
jgi:hypothetical protein